jgi:hypothetical protein
VTSQHNRQPEGRIMFGNSGADLKIADAFHIRRPGAITVRVA